MDGNYFAVVKEQISFAAEVPATMDNKQFHQVQPCSQSIQHIAVYSHTPCVSEH